MKQDYGLEYVPCSSGLPAERGVTLRDQLVTQIILGILCNDLAPGERLPSTRSLARRFGVHPNTISAAYSRLEKDHWVESRRGSGIYVREAPPERPPSDAMELDQLIRQFLRSARTLGVPLESVRARVQHWFQLQPPDHFVLIEPDRELRGILVAEMQETVRLPVRAARSRGHWPTGCPRRPRRWLASRLIGQNS